MPDQRKPMLSAEELAFVKGNGFQPHPDAPKEVSSPVEVDTAPPAPPEPKTTKRAKLPMVETPEATVRFTVDLRRTQHEELKKAALNARMPMTALIRHIVADWLSAEEEE